MGRRVDVDDLVSGPEIAERLGMASAKVVHEWRHRDIGFPEPVVVLGATRVWAWPDVERWAKSTGRL